MKGKNKRLKQVALAAFVLVILAVALCTAIQYLPRNNALSVLPNGVSLEDALQNSQSFGYYGVFAPTDASISAGQTVDFTIQLRSSNDLGIVTPVLYDFTVDGETFLPVGVSVNSEGYVEGGYDDVYTFQFPSQGTYSLDCTAVFYGYPDVNTVFALQSSVTVNVGEAPAATIDPEQPHVSLILGISGSGSISGVCGEISQGEGTQNYYTDSTVLLTATANSGNHFSYWLLDDGTRIDSATYSLEMPSDRTALAVFAVDSANPTATPTASNPLPTPDENGVVPTPTPYGATPTPDANGNIPTPAPSGSQINDPTPIPIESTVTKQLLWLGFIPVSDQQYSFIFIVVVVGIFLLAMLAVVFSVASKKKKSGR